MSKENECWIHPKTESIVTCKGRILWHSLFGPRKTKKNDGKHEFNLLLPKESKLKVLQEKVLEAGKSGTKAKVSKAFKDAKDGKWPSSVKTPFKKTEGNDKLVAALEEAGLKVEDFPIYIAARSKDKPGLVGPNGKADGIEPEHVYSGRWARMTVDAFDYDYEGSLGVSLGLKNVQLLDNDDELVVGGGRVSAESEFDAVEGAGEDGKSADSMFG